MNSDRRVDVDDLSLSSRFVGIVLVEKNGVATGNSYDLRTEPLTL